MKPVEKQFYKNFLDVGESIARDKEALKELFKGSDLDVQIAAIKKIKDELASENKKPTVLVVDDEPHIVNLIKLSLENEFNILTANSGNEALHKAKEEQPDLITMDIMMPGMSGFEVVEELKKWDDTSEIPVIFLSAKDKLKDMYEGMEIGAEDYITKPFEPDELSQRIKSSLKK